MLISGVTFIRNGSLLAYPFIESIRSILPIVDEFVINIGPSEDDTLERIEKLAKAEPKIRILQSSWCENMQVKGYVYGQQKMIAMYNARGRYLFYLEADEVVHEDSLGYIREMCERYDDDVRVEGFAFRYLHFYGNEHTIMDSPHWYRSEIRILKTSVRAYAPDGLFFNVLEDSHKKARYPNAVLLDAYIYHYGWLRPEESMSKKGQKVGQYWGQKDTNFKASYKDIDPRAFALYTSPHPALMASYLASIRELGQAEGLADKNSMQEDFIDRGANKASTKVGEDTPLTKPALFETSKEYIPSKKERRYFLMKVAEKLLGIDLSKRHYKRVKP